MTDSSEITRTFDLRAQALEPFASFLSCDVRSALDALVLAIKGKPSAGEAAGGLPLSGRDGVALTAAFERLGWSNTEWCGVLLAPGSADLGADPGADLGADSGADPGADSLTEEPERLRLLLEILDPLLIVALDEEARVALVNALDVGDHLAAWEKKTAAEAQGRLLISVDDFEAALDSEVEKQLVWQQLKRAARTEALKRLK